MVMIEVSHLQKNFSKTIKEPGLKGDLKSFVHPQREIFEAVKDLSFEVPKGQILGFIGANGAGKSTTIKMLTGILKPTSGYCRINGKIPQDNRQDYVRGHWSCFWSTNTTMVGFGLARDLCRFKRNLRCA
ncbi:daunorubicin resistance ATP-binding protein [Streptococcus pyogenes]|nr:daunorubicin resistance ATP-binding protein [Streptococcus pyogenes]